MSALRDALERRIRRRRGGQRSGGGPAGDPFAALLDRANPATLSDATGEKVILYRHLGALGIPIPRLMGVVGSAGGWDAGADRLVTGTEDVAAFLATLPGEFVVKPSAGSRGAGVRVLRRDGELLADIGGRASTRRRWPGSCSMIRPTSCSWSRSG